MKFIIYEQNSHPLVADNGNIISDGIIGRVTLNNVYLTAYAMYPNKQRPKDLEIGECITGVRYSLSDETGMYNIYRVS